LVSASGCITSIDGILSSEDDDNLIPSILVSDNLESNPEDERALLGAEFVVRAIHSAA
jgi:hypothetical protein